MEKKLEFPRITPYWDFDCKYTDATLEDIRDYKEKGYTNLHIKLSDHWKYKEYILQELKRIDSYLKSGRKITGGVAVSALAAKIRRGL
jgi:hypothetical protein